MKLWKPLAISAATLTLAFGMLPTVDAAPAPPTGQVSIGVNIGAAPVCPYGYFDYAPYDCAPYGYYGPDWFTGGIFVGAGPWFHSPRPGWFGHVDNRYDPRQGYKGPMPARGAAPFQHFQGNEARDGNGHTGNAGHEPTQEHSAGFAGTGHPGGGPAKPAGGGHPR